jgi:hypothetical protein
VNEGFLRQHPPREIPLHRRPEGICPGEATEGGPLSHEGSRQPHRIGHGRMEFEPAMPANSEETKLLRIAPRTPILYIESVVYTKENLPVEYVEKYLDKKPKKGENRTGSNRLFEKPLNFNLLYFKQLRKSLRRNN